MKLGMQNNILRPKMLFKDINFTVKNKFEYFEIVTETPFYSPSKFSNQSTKRLKKFDINYNIHVSTSIYLILAARDENMRIAVEKSISDNIELGRKLDIGLINVHYYGGYFFPNVSKEFKSIIDKNRGEMIDKFVREAKKYGIKFTIENTRGNTASEIKRLFDRHKELMLTFDIHHAFLENGSENIFQFINRFSKRIINVHLLDGNKIKSTHMALGEGDIPVVKVVQVLKKIFDGPYILEMQTRKDILKSIKFLKERELYYS